MGEQREVLIFLQVDTHWWVFVSMSSGWHQGLKKGIPKFERSKMSLMCPKQMGSPLKQNKLQAKLHCQRYMYLYT